MKNPQKYTNFQLYEKIRSIMLKEISAIDGCAEVKAQFFALELQLHTLISWALHDRFIAPTPAKKAKPSKHSVDMQKFLGEFKPKSEQPKNENISMLHLIKFFKDLERFMLSRRFSVDQRTLELGILRKPILSIIDNLPTLLLSVDQLTDGLRLIFLRYLFSLIVVYRQFKTKTLPDTNTISDPYNGVPIDTVIAKWFNADRLAVWVTQFLSRIDKERRIRLSMYSGNASSPNTGASATKLFKDVASVWNDATLWDAIIEMCRYFKNGDHLLRILNAVKCIYKDYDSGNTHSRLVHFTAPGGKARIIAIADWVSQTVLSGLHFWMFYVLRTIPSDFTFNHKGGIHHVMECKEFKEKTDGYNFYSIDLTAATDRLPRTLQALILQSCMQYLGLDGKAIAGLWLKIMHRTFTTNGSPINKGQPIQYAVGQGMGLFTSWPMLAFMHHYVINGIVGVPMARYCLVGDDLLFFGTPAEYAAYVDFMSDIGVTVNPTKTIVSRSLDRPSIEFARNFVVDGLLIRPLQWGAVFAWRDLKIHFETLLWYLSENWSYSVLEEFITHFTNSKTSLFDWIRWIYFLFKTKAFSFATDTITAVTLPAWCTQSAFERIIAITKNENAKGTSGPDMRHAAFMGTYDSQLTVRTREEQLLCEDVADSVLMLTFVDDDDLVPISESIFNRLMGADIISYDVDLSEGPLLTKRERNLLLEVTKAQPKKTRPLESQS